MSVEILVAADSTRSHCTVLQTCSSKCTSAHGMNGMMLKNFCPVGKADCFGRVFEIVIPLPKMKFALNVMIN